MANSGLDPFVHVLFTQVVPFLILAGVLGLLLGGVMRWLEHGAPRLIGAHRHVQPPARVNAAAFEQDDESIPDCPMCNVPMVKRTARRGPRAGAQFWGCSNFPMCRSTRERK
ncbi:MAG: topoisomerase DNA-binding C4 zinc finger domain-containing protein [Spartobacteria bacterium]